ncbi:NAD-binding protein [Rhodobacterales bacterium HKCCE2091]|nr:NAD-binding protein [Rhodobacterales bacterium HKCCE2091]
MKIGYVGLGDMGGALARRLQLSRPLTVFDLSEAAMTRLTDKGATAAGSLGDLARDCEVIFLCLPKSAHVRAAIFGDGGLSTALRPGTLIVDQTTGDPAETRAMAAELAARGVTLIDAPVSGGAAGAEAGTIAIMVGADPADHERALPILHDISPNVFHAGGVGAGHTMKLVNNLLSGAQRVLTMECLALAQKNGIAPVDAVRILMAGGARNVFLEKGVGPVVERGDLGTGFTLELMHKDIDLACRAGKDAGIPMYFGALTREMYQLAMNLVGAQEPVNSAAVAIDRIAGSKIVAGS